ncbi:MAG TPA: hypothetical protein VK174_07320, partial [Chitinophagales bacterium]|nr:hypothetical protein [Chitinophagales bacterium]
VYIKPILLCKNEFKASYFIRLPNIQKINSVSNFTQIDLFLFSTLSEATTTLPAASVIPLWRNTLSLNSNYSH